MPGKPTAHYELFYWPTIQGRGEFVRLALEDADAHYTDVARQRPEDGGGVPAMMHILRGDDPGIAPFAPPFVRCGALVVAQTANVLQYLAPRLGLVPDDDASRLHAHQLMLTVMDFVGEVHETHHPVGTGLYYEDQKPEAKRRAGTFVAERLPKFTRYFERVLTRNDGEHLLGSAVTYVDLAAFQVVSGLEYSFPRALAAVSPALPRLLALRDRIAARPRLAAYLASPRRLPFNRQGIFRHYPELDAPAPAGGP